MSVLRTLVRYSYVPFMLLGVNGLAYWLITSGYSFAWLLPVLVGAFLVAHLAERVLPWYPEWNSSHGDEPTTLAHILYYETSNITAVLMIPLIVWLFPFEGIWPTHWPVFVQLLIAVLVADFAFTMVHYFSHQYPILWRLHAVHHGVERLHGFNGIVRHPLHQALDMIVGTLPLAILGMPVQVAVLLGFAVSLQLIIQHSNVASSLGPLRNWLSLGQLHHLHHVNWGKEGDCNYGLFFSFWDWMLGTLRPEPPRTIQAHDMGIDDAPDFPKGYIAQLVFPFVYTPGELGAKAERNGQPDAAFHPAE